MGFHTSSGTLSVRNTKLARANLAELPKIHPGVLSREIAPGIVETDYGVTKTLQVAGQTWYELPDKDPAAQWYRMPDTRGDYDPLFAGAPKFPDAEKSRGFVVYQTPDTMVASSSGFPDHKNVLEPGKPMKVSLCPGETRSAVVGVYPIVDYPAYEVKFTTFTDAAGNRIAPENLRADYLETVCYRANEFQQYLKDAKSDQEVRSHGSGRRGSHPILDILHCPQRHARGSLQGQGQAALGRRRVRHARLAATGVSFRTGRNARPLELGTTTTCRTRTSMLTSSRCRTGERTQSSTARLQAPHSRG